MRTRRMSTPIKYIQANFTECDGIDLLSVFLRKSQRLFPNFNSNEKRTIYDGDLDYLNNNKEIIKIFRCQIKTLKSVHGTFKIDYKYLSACSNKVSFDPLFFFLVDVGNPKGPRFFYLNLTIFKPNIVSECVKDKKSLNVKIKDFTELSTPDDLVKDIENNYLYTLSLSDLSLEELRILMSGISYLNSCINKVPVIRNYLFPNFYSFVVGYEKNTNEGVETGLYSLKHDVISIMPTVVDSKTDLITKYNPLIERSKFVSRSFNNKGVDEDVFKDYLSYVLKEGFYYSENLLTIMPIVVIYEIIYAALNYETIKLGNAKTKVYCKSETLSLNDIRHIELSEHNLYRRHFKAAVEICDEKQIEIIEKVWHYWDYSPLDCDNELFRNEVKKLFSMYSRFVNQLLKILIGENMSEYAFFYEFDQIDNTKMLSVTMISKPLYEYLDREKMQNKEKANLTKYACFENMKSFSPLFNTLLNKCYQSLCTKFDCKYDVVSVDGVKTYTL